MSSESPPKSLFGEAVPAWSALGAARLAVVAFAACCVLPIALSLAGLALAGLSVIAGQRVWITLIAAVVLGVGWWRVWRRPRARASAALTRWVLVGATGLMLVALIWRRLTEPEALRLLWSRHA